MDAMTTMTTRIESMENVTPPNRHMPHLGWHCIEIADRGKADFTCEWCAQAIIRFVHRLEHEDYFEFVRTGCCCAGHLTGDEIGARVRERTFKLARARREKWLTSAWTRAADGRLFLNRSGVNLSVFPIGDGRFGAVVSRESGDWKKWAGRAFTSETRAKNAALAVVIESKPSKAELKWTLPKSKASKSDAKARQLDLSK
jgi:hypothetical protein